MAVAQAQSGRLVRLERRAVDQDPGRHATIESDNRSLRRSPICRRKTTRNSTTALPTACCGRSCIIGSISPNSRAATSSGYIRVNEHFADESARSILQPDDVIWVHDYHFMPLAKALRERGHKNKIGFFLHMPFPPAGNHHRRCRNHERLIPALCHYDLVGFQTETDADNFARYRRKRVPAIRAIDDERLRHRRSHRAGRQFPGRRRDRELSRKLARRAIESSFVREVSRQPVRAAP